MTDKEENKSLSMIIHPLKGDGVNLSLSSFSNSIDSFKKVAGKFHCNDLQIVKLTSNSPISLTVENAHNENAPIYSGSLKGILDGLVAFMDSGEIPLNWTRPTIDAVLDFLNPIGTSIGRFELFSNSEKKITLDLDYKTSFKNKIEDDFSSVGTVDGMLEAVNIHGRKNAVALYPVIGNDKIVLDFDDHHLEKIKQLIGFYVEIGGELIYRWRDKYPYRGTIESIEHIVEDGLPTFSDLYGMAKNATNGIPAEDFISGIRSERK